MTNHKSKAQIAKENAEKEAAKKVPSEVLAEKGHEQSPEFTNPDKAPVVDAETNTDTSTEPPLAHANEAAATGNEVVESNVLTEDEKLKNELDAELHKDLVEEGKEVEETITLTLRVKPSHPNHRFHLLDKAIVGHQFAEYELTQAQFEDLLNDGPMNWIECEEHSDLKELKKKYEAQKVK